MPNKEIYLIRHGETDLNRQGIVQGRGMNTDLNDTGRQQARDFYTAYQDIPFNKIYISSLKRTYQTVEPFIKDGIPYEELEGLDELCWGEWEGKPSTADSRRVFMELAQQWVDGDYNTKCEGGESPNEVLERLKQAMQVILARDDESCVLICMHGRAMRLLLCHLTGEELCEMPKFPHQNTTLYRLSYQDGWFSILDFNNNKHLKH